MDPRPFFRLGVGPRLGWLTTQEDGSHDNGNERDTTNHEHEHDQVIHAWVKHMLLAVFLMLESSVRAPSIGGMSARSLLTVSVGMGGGRVACVGPTALAENPASSSPTTSSALPL